MKEMIQREFTTYGSSESSLLLTDVDLTQLSTSLIISKLDSITSDTKADT